jgi:hypothetical protein
MGKVGPPTTCSTRNQNDLAMKALRKHDLPVGDIRRFLEPGPITLVSSALQRD